MQTRIRLRVMHARVTKSQIKGSRCVKGQWGGGGGGGQMQLARRRYPWQILEAGTTRTAETNWHRHTE